MNFSNGSILRGSDASISDARSKVSEIKLTLREALESTPVDQIRTNIKIKEALALLTELDDRG